MAEKAKYIIGIESVKPAVIDANRNAVLNGVINARYICGKAEEVLPVLAEADPTHLETVLKDAGLPKESLVGVDEDVAAAVKKADVVILDPPRKGCHTALLDAVRKLAPERIVYVSCDPATLARDIAYLVDPDGHGDSYILEKAAPFDMFPRTGHVETVVLMSRADR
jgi:23S rRNA (uracil1939-C5)-methyltransferase